MGNYTEQVIRDYFNKSTWIAVPELVARILKHIALGLTRGEEATRFEDVSGASRVHPIILTIDEGDGER